MNSPMTLDTWLRLVFSPLRQKVVEDYRFPTDKLRNEYVASIQNRAEEEVIGLVRRFLIPSGFLGSDDWPMTRILETIRNGTFSPQTEWERRAAQYIHSRGKAPPAWEGITWIIDLLPSWPGEALKALDAYFLAHAQLFPDGRFNGLSDAAELIRARFIGIPESLGERVAHLKSLTPRDFEHIVERLYFLLDYETILTPTGKDGGSDVIANRREKGRSEALRIQCKRYESKVGVHHVRELLGVISAEKANKGVLVTSGTFTAGAIAFAEANPRIELISGAEFVRLFNEVDGTWPAHIERLLLESRQRAIGQKHY